MGSEIYRGMRVVPGWVKPYLFHLKEANVDPQGAARLVAVSTHVVQSFYDSDPEFKTDYDAAFAHAQANPKHGRRSW